MILNKTAGPGYIMLVTLMVIALCLIMATGTFYRMVVYTPFVSGVLARERAKMIALSGLQIALNQIYDAGKKPEKQTNKTADTKAPAPKSLSDQMLFFKTIFSLLNRWQQVTLTEKTENIEGSIEYMISCEEGKINVNTVYDFKKKEFIDIEGSKGQMQRSIQELCAAIEQKTGTKDLFDNVRVFLNAQKHPITDVTQLCTIGSIALVFKDRIFSVPVSKQKEQTPQSLLFLTDLFTVEGKSGIDPWFLSESMRVVLNFASARARNDKELASVLEDVVPKIQAQAQWNTDWKTVLAPLYQKEWEQVNAFMKPLFKTVFGSLYFSVVCYGTASSVTQGLYAIVELKKQTNNEDDRYQFDVRIKRLYWI